MLELAVVAGLLSALFWGIQPVFAKRGLSHGGDPIELTAIVVTTSLVTMSIVLAVLEGPTDAVPSIGATGFAVFLLGGFIGSAVGRFANYSGVNRVGASVNSAVVSTNPLFATLMALVFLGEVISPVQGIGVVVVVVGLAAVTLSKAGDLTGWRYHELLIPVTAAMAYASGSIFRRYGLTTTSATPIEGAVLNEIAAFIGIFGFIAYRRGRVIPRVPTRAAMFFVGSGLAGAMGVLMLFVGLSAGPVAIVVTLSGTATLVTNGFSYAFLGDLERVNRGIVIGATLVVIGVGLIVVA